MPFIGKSLYLQLNQNWNQYKICKLRQIPASGCDNTAYARPFNGSRLWSTCRPTGPTRRRMKFTARWPLESRHCPRQPSTIPWNCWCVRGRRHRSKWTRTGCGSTGICDLTDTFFAPSAELCTTFFSNRNDRKSRCRMQRFSLRDIPFGRLNSIIKVSARGVGKKSGPATTEQTNNNQLKINLS